MHKPNLKRFVKSVQKGLSKHSPGMITTTVLAVRETPRALQLIEEKKEEEGKDELTPVETVKTCWKCYAPAAVTGVFSIACLIGSNSVNARRNAALATAYKISETALTEYRDKVVETIGEKKEQVIRDKVCEERVKKNPVNNSEIIITGRGTTRCYDSLSGRYFESDIETIKRAENELNKRMLNDMYVSLNEFYDELDLNHTSVGDELGWNIDDGLIDIYFSSNISEDGVPCIVIDYRVAPRYNFSRLT